MLCYRCGIQVKDGADKCWKCGAQLAGGASTSIPSLDELRERQKTRSRLSGVVHKVGDVIGGRYEVKDILGSGGAGVVYRTHDQEIDVEVAVKVINAKLVQTSDEKKLFSKEVKTARKLSHQNIVRIFDEGHDGDRVFASMQFLDGLPLRKIIDLRRSKEQLFTVEEVEPLLNQLCQALDYAHRFTFHGNLKPDNVIVLPELLKITDFGILKALPRKPFLAIQKARKVNFNYYAPEVRLEVRDLNKRVDIYSLGVIVWEMLTGQVYEDGKSDGLNSKSVDANIARVIKRCVARTPKDRYKSAGAMYNAFREVMESGSASSVPASVSTIAKPKPPPPPGSSAVVASNTPIAKKGEPEPGTGRFESIDDAMIEDSSTGSVSAEVVASSLEIPPLAEGEDSSDLSTNEAADSVEEPEELNESEIELIADPKATNVLSLSDIEERQVEDAPKIIDDEEEAPETSKTSDALVEPSEYGEDDEDEATEAWSSGIPNDVIETGSEDSTGDEKPNDPLASRPQLRPVEGPTEAEKMPPELLEKHDEVMSDQPTTKPRTRPSVVPPPPQPQGGPRMSSPVRKPKARPATRPRMSAIRNPTMGFENTNSSGSIPAPSFAPPPPQQPQKNNALIVIAGGFLVLFALIFFLQWQQNQKQIDALTNTIEQISKKETVARKTIEDEDIKAREAQEAAEKAAAAELEAQKAAVAEADRKRKAEEEAKAAAMAEARARNEAAAEAARKLKEEKQREADEAARAEIAAREREKIEAEKRARQDEARRRAESNRERERKAAERLAEERRRQEDRRAALREERAEKQRERAERAKERAEERRRANEEARQRAEERRAAERARREEAKKAAAIAAANKDPECPRGMILVKAGRFRQGSAANDPERNFGDLGVKQVEVAAFCMDYYEYPNGKKRTPTTRVSYSRAERSCKRRGKRLCSEEEWEKACTGPRNIRYPYGNAWSSDSCATEDEEGNDRTVQKSGSFKACRSGYGALDMAGNVAEWTSTAWGSGMVVKGGAADRPGYDSRCAARKKKKKKYSSEMLGFRCCANPK